jgi:hypothetical protein
MPGALVACYDGPAGTEGVGRCKAGFKSCNADGVTFGVCKGQAVPGFENCASPVDEDCDGLASSCTGIPLWGERFGDSDGQSPTGLATDSDGNVVVAGYFSGAINFGGDSLVCSGGFDVFLAKLDANGKHLWSKRFGDKDSQAPGGVAVDSMGNVLIAGYFNGGIDLGGGLLTSKGGSDVFIAKLDAKGEYVWGQRFGDDSTQGATGVAVDGSGDVVLIGGFDGVIDFGGGALTSKGGSDVFIAKLDAKGKYLWAQSFGDESTQGANGVAVDSMGNVLVVGYFNGGIDFGGGLLTSKGGSDIFIAKLSADGHHVWSKSFGDASTQNATSVAVDGSGNIVLTGQLSGTVDLGGGTLNGPGDMFVAKLDAGGKHVWSKLFGDKSAESANGIAVDKAGNLVVTGYFSGSVDVGGGQLVSAGGADIFAAKLDTDGNHLWSKRFGNANDQTGVSAAMDGHGNTVLAGYFSGTVDIGSSSLVCDGGYDAVLAKFAP